MYLGWILGLKRFSASLVFQAFFLTVVWILFLFYILISSHSPSFHIMFKILEQLQCVAFGIVDCVKLSV